VCCLIGVDEGGYFADPEIVARSICYVISLEGARARPKPHLQVPIGGANRHYLKSSQYRIMEIMMARRKPPVSNEFVFFDVVYEDGSRLSNRKVPSDLVGGLDGDEPAKAILEAQDQKIAALSGRPRGAIKSIARSSSR
jgi:hypothetical protein